MSGGGRTRLAVWGAIALLILLAVVHYWTYLTPGERAGVPSPELVALWADAERFERALWIAAPHQNLGALDERVGDLSSYLEEVGRLAGSELPRLPSFGPFTMPPSSEVVLAWNGEGGSFVGAARIESGIGFLARLAGKLAGNPWLAGGEVRSGGRLFHVRWQSSIWIVATATEPALEGSARPAAEGVLTEPAIAWLRLSRPAGPVPPGRYRLARGEDGLEFRAGEIPPDLHPASDWSFPGVALWTSSTDRGPVGGPGALLLWEATEGAIPRVAVLQRGGGRAFRLPGESVLELLGAAEPAGRLGWTVRATQKSARRDALLLVPWFERHLVRPGGRGPWLASAGRLAPAASVRTLGLLLESLRKLPLLPPAEIGRIEAAKRLLSPFQGCAAVSFEVWREPDGARLRLCSRAAEEGLAEGAAELDEELDAAGKIDERP